MAEAEHAEALREADRLKDALLASVSHDLRTPLTTIKALAHDIAVSGDERAAVIEQQSDRLNHMVADLLELSRLNAGGLPLEVEINAAEDLVGAAIQQVSAVLAGREVHTSLAWSEPVPIGRFDFVHSLRILVNLIENAVKYSPAGTPIDLAMGTEGEMLSISVGDRGTRRDAGRARAYLRGLLPPARSLAGRRRRRARARHRAPARRGAGRGARLCRSPRRAAASSPSACPPRAFRRCPRAPSLCDLFMRLRAFLTRA